MPLPPDEVIAVALERGLRSIRLPRHREMFAAALALRRDEPDGLTLSRDLAPAVFAAASGTTLSRLDIAALSYILWVAFDVLDDVADGDAAAKWPDVSGAELTVMASSLIAATAHEIAATLDESPLVRERLHLRIARGIGEMADGQIADLADTGRADITADRIFTSVAGKTGAECALFAGLGAIVAGTAPERCEHFEQFGTEYGIANQYVTDLLELFADDVSRDLVNGTRTLPIVWHIEGLAGVERDAFLDLLERARRDPAAAASARATLAASPTVRRTLLQIMIHIERARAALVLAQPSGPAAALLEQFLLDLNPIACA